MRAFTFASVLVVLGGLAAAGTWAQTQGVHGTAGRSVPADPGQAAQADLGTGAPADADQALPADRVQQQPVDGGQPAEPRVMLMAAWPGAVPQVIDAAFAPLGPGAVAWARRVAMCESGYNPNAVNPYSGARGLFQFLPSTWALTPYAASSPFDPTANARAAAWLYVHGGPGNWQCR